MVCLTIKEKALGWSRQKRLRGELSGYIFLFLQQASLFFFLKEVEMLHGCQPWAEASPLLPHLWAWWGWKGSSALSGQNKRLNFPFELSTRWFPICTERGSACGLSSPPPLSQKLSSSSPGPCPALGSSIVPGLRPPNLIQEPGTAPPTAKTKKAQFLCNLNEDICHEQPLVVH